MAADQPSWNVVRRGLEFKLAALVLFAGLPLLAPLLWYGDLNLRWLLLGVAFAAAPDFLGRCLCLAAPLPRRLSIALSVVFEAFAFGAIAAIGYAGTRFELGVGVLVAGSLQLASAVLFVNFLRAASEALQRPDATRLVDQLSWRLSYGLFATWGLGFATFIAAGIVLTVSVVTCGFGFYVAAPIAALVLLPVALLTAGSAAAMYWAYGSAMWSVRAGITEPQ